MPGLFENKLLISDLDGTLFGKDFKIPEKNLAALSYFKQNGGRFAIATGRTIDSASRYVAMTRPTAPCIVLNGAVLYDYSASQILWEHPMQDTAREYVRKIQRAFPSVGIELCTDDVIQVVGRNAYIESHVGREGIKHCFCTLEEAEPRWYKAFFAMEPELLPKLTAFVQTFDHQDVRFVASSANYYEMLPNGVDKGNALKKLVELEGFSRKNVFAVGDYFNDLELLAAAGTSLVTSNAPDEVKVRADALVCSCWEGAIADAVAYIEAHG